MSRVRQPLAHDTAALKQLAAEKKLEGEVILEKINKFKSFTQTRKKTTQQSDHKFLWLEECRKLSDERKSLDQDIERTLREFAATSRANSNSNSGSGSGSGNTTSRRSSKESELELDDLFTEIVKEQSENASSRHTAMNEILGGIRGLNMTIQQIKNREGSTTEKEKEFLERFSAIKDIITAQIACLESETIALDHQISEMRSASLQSNSLFPHSVNSHSLSESPFHTPTATPRLQATSSTSSPLSSRPTSASTAHSVPYSTISSTFSDSSQLTDSSFIFKLNQLPCKDVQLVESLHDEWNRMEQRFKEQLTDLRERFMTQNEVKDVKLGTWEAKAHFHFMTLYKQYVHKGRREEFVERAVVEMPSKSRVEIEYHLQFVRKQYLYRIHQKSIKGMWRRERALWFENAKELVQEANLITEQRIKKDMEASEMQRKREYLQKKLAAWRDEKAKNFAQMMEKLRTEEQQALEKERLLNERLARAKDVKKQLVSEYKQIKREIVEQKAIEEEQIKQEQEILRKEQEEINKERTNYRTEELELRRQAKAQKKLEDQKMEQLKEIQLEKLRETVRIRAESDTARTYQGTVASTTIARNLPPLFQPNNGYSDATITGDTRFKIERALDKAGLLHTKYAQEVLSSVPTNIRIDQLSSEQKEVYIKNRVV